MTAILNAIISWKAAEGFSRTFSMLFSPYFQSYPENVSLLWAISSVHIMLFLMTAILDAILSFVESCRWILQDFQYVILPIFPELH